MSGSIYDGDQPTTAPLVIAPQAPSSTATVNASAPQVDAIVVANNEAPTYVFSNNYTVVYQHQTLSFRYGVPYQLDAGLLAFLTAAGAPINAA